MIVRTGVGSHQEHLLEIPPLPFQHIFQPFLPQVVGLQGRIDHRAVADNCDLGKILGRLIGKQMCIRDRRNTVESVMEHRLKKAAAAL